MTLAFITSIRHPQNAMSYQRVGMLLDATLRSVCRQTTADFRVVVVHNTRPPTTFEDDRISYVQVDFDPPSAERSSHVPFAAFQRDKGSKNVIGVAATRHLGASHVMLFDADDYIHHGLAQLASSHPDHPGWYSPQGYIHTAGMRSVQHVPTGFHNKNGSTTVMRTDLYAVPDAVTTNSTQEQILDHMTVDHVDRLFGGHGEWNELAQRAGFELEALPFPMAVWEIGTGENHSGNLVSGRSRRPLDAAITDAFGLALPSRGASVRAHASLTRRRAILKIRGTNS